MPANLSDFHYRKAIDHPDHYTTPLRDPADMGPLNPTYVILEHIGGKGARKIAKELRGWEHCRHRLHPGCPHSCTCSTVVRAHEIIKRWRRWGSPTGRDLEIIMDQMWGHRSPSKWKYLDEGVSG